MNPTSNCLLLAGACLSLGLAPTGCASEDAGPCARAAAIASECQGLELLSTFGTCSPSDEIVAEEIIAGGCEAIDMRIDDGIFCLDFLGGLGMCEGGDEPISAGVDNLSYILDVADFVDSLDAMSNFELSGWTAAGAPCTVAVRDHPSQAGIVVIGTEQVLDSGSALEPIRFLITTDATSQVMEYSRGDGVLATRASVASALNNVDTTMAIVGAPDTTFMFTDHNDDGRVFSCSAPNQ